MTLELPWEERGTEPDPDVLGLAEVLRSRLCAAPDYAVIGRKLG